MISQSKKLFISMFTIILMLTLLSTVTYAAYENDQYITVTRTLSPSNDAPELGSSQQIRYTISGGEFQLDPSVVDPTVLAEKDIALVLDISGSMTASIGSGKTRMDVLKESAVNFINKFAGTKTKICIIPFESTANRATELLSLQDANNVAFLINTVNALTATGMTNTGDGMRRAYWNLKNIPDDPSGNKKYMILMTDGDANYVTYANSSRTVLKYDNGQAVYNASASSGINYAMNLGNMLKVEGVNSLFIGLTSSVSASLNNIAASAGAGPTPGGLNYYRVITAADLTNIYNLFADEIASTFPITASFRDIIPAGTAVVSIPQGFTSQVQADGSTIITGSIAVSLEKKATGLYSITPWEGIVSVRYHQTGAVSLNNLTLSYMDPFGNQKTAPLQNNLTLNVVDTTPPSEPQGLILLKNLGSSVQIGWDASADLSGITGYEVYRDGSYLATTASTSFMDTGLAQAHPYEYTVRAVDASNLRSAHSLPLQVLTLDVESPSVPTNLAFIPSSSSAVISWESSTDNVGVAGYHIYQDGEFICTVTENEYTATNLLPNLTYVFSISAVDAAGNESEKALLSVKTNTPPIASAGPDQTVEGIHSNGAFVMLDASGSSDPENNPLTYTWTGSFGTISGETASVELPLGSHTITLTVNDGEFDATDEVIVQVVDTTAPFITGAPTTSANAEGWYNSDVLVHFSAEDPVSGIKAITPDVTLTDEGENQSVTGTAEDNAGNTASVTISNINIDRTKPMITASVPVPNENGWYNHDVTIQFAAEDNLSGISAVTSPVTVSTDGAGQSVTGIASDRAGNTESIVISGIHVDKTAPVIIMDSFLAGDYETSESVLFHYSVLESISGVQSESVDLNGSPITNGQIINLNTLAGTNTLTVHVSDMAGNIGTVTHTFNVAVSSEIDISPKTLNLKSKGGDNSVTAKITLLNGYSTSDIDISSVLFTVNGSVIAAQPDISSSGNKNHKMVKLDRNCLISALKNTTGEVSILVTGKLADGRSFSGVASIHVK